MVVMMALVRGMVALHGLTMVSCVYRRSGSWEHFTEASWSMASARGHQARRAILSSHKRGSARDYWRSSPGRSFCVHGHVNDEMSALLFHVRRSCCSVFVSLELNTRQQATSNYIQPLLRHVPCRQRAERTLDLLPNTAWPLILLLTCSCSLHQARGAPRQHHEQRATPQKMVYDRVCLWSSKTS